MRVVRRVDRSVARLGSVQRATALHVGALILALGASASAQSNVVEELARLGQRLSVGASADERSALVAAAEERFHSALAPDFDFERAHAAHERWWSAIRPHATLQDLWGHQQSWAYWLHEAGFHVESRCEYDVLASAPGLTIEQRFAAQNAAIFEAVDLNDHADVLRRCAATALEPFALLDPSVASATRVQLAMFQSNVFVARGLTDRALIEMERANAECACEEDVAWRIDVRLAQCNVYLATEQFERIERLLDADLIERLRVEAPELCGIALIRLGTARSELARTQRTRGDEAVLVLEEALDFVAQQADELAHARLVLVDLALRRKEPQRALTLLETVAAGPSSGLEQRVRAAALRVCVALDLGEDFATLRGHVDTLERGLFAYLESWRAKPVRKGGVGFLHWGSQRLAFSSWIRAQLHLDPSRVGVERALAPILEAHELASTARVLSGTSSLAELRATMIEPSRGVLVYMPGPDSSYVFCIDELDTTVHPLADRDTLHAQAKELDRAWTMRPEGNPSALARRRERLTLHARTAYEAFLPPEVRARITPWREVVVIGADLCGEPSFEVFALEAERWLGLDKALTYSNSSALALALDARDRGRANAFERDLVVVGAPLEARGPGASTRKRSAIELTQDDRDSLLAGFEPSSCLVRLRDEATIDALRESVVGNSGVLTIFAHGEFTPGACVDDERSTLVLLTPGRFDDGVLCCSDLEALDLPPLVELLSCGSARGPLRFGDGGASHLVGAGFIAGARAVLASRFDIGVDASLALVRPYHRSLRRDGKSPMLALLDSRRVLASDPKTADPWFWASLTLHGAAWRPVFAAADVEAVDSEEEATSSVLLVVAVLALAVFGASATFARRRSA